MEFVLPPHFLAHTRKSFEKKEERNENERELVENNIINEKKEAY